MSERAALSTVDERIEQRGLWWSFHKHLILDLFEALREGLGDEYLVDLESEILLVPRPAGTTRLAEPDVSVSQVPSPAEAAATPTLTPAVVEADEAMSEFEQYSVEIRSRNLPDPNDPFGVQVVSVLELLSPSNKGASGERDRRMFLAKRRDYLSSRWDERLALAGG